MGQLTMPRLTPQKLDDKYLNTESIGMASGAVLYVGGIIQGKTVGTGSALRAVRGQQGTGLRVLGVLDNQPHLLPLPSYQSVSDGFPQVQFKRGTFKFNISLTDPVTLADLWTVVYVEDDQTIRRSWGGGFSAAGELTGIDDYTSPTGPGAWVRLGDLSMNAPQPTGFVLP